MRISNDISPEDYVSRIGPNYFSYGDRIECDYLVRKTDFRTHAKFSKRMYYAFKPLWWAMHYADELALDRFPVPSFGFTTLTAYPDPDPETTTSDGQGGMVFTTGTGQSWANMRDGVGNNVGSASTTMWLGKFQDDNTGTGWKQLFRSVALFDTSSIGTDTISSGTLSFFGNLKSDDLSITPDFNVYSATVATNNNLVATDFGETKFGDTEFSTTLTYANASATAYNDFALNESGLSAIDASGVTKFGTRNVNHDVDNVEPGHVALDASSGLRVNAADTAGTTTDPKLVVEHAAEIRVRMFPLLGVGK